ncbi:DUF192 domain-containing protein [Oscillatoria sp. FACHB-1406]|uniref:DUF192 domain-containing protein n=1 Tax=Oscillatoria sp. FACHB-1406 TaxID=2692846 RepID=UPI0016887E29|nr:DUF192 domain-containing protein [Oscillatoria sp. FACHB-1406]MBD2580015.1 DUF192 domain-containing protein [Oscillatoria sp. FACHB-1406]
MKNERQLPIEKEKNFCGLGKLSTILAISIFMFGCATPGSTPSSSNSASTGTSIISTPPGGQVLPIEATAVLGGETIELEVARTSAQQSLGLMFRDRLPDNRGMLFPFTPAREVGFWMKNVPVGLDMVFVRQGVIRAIVTAPPCTDDPCPTYGPAEPIDGVIELREGRAEELGLKIGDGVELRLGADASGQ